MVTMNFHPWPDDGRGSNRGNRSKSPTRHKKALAQEPEEEEIKNFPSNHPKRDRVKYGCSTLVHKGMPKGKREMEAEDDGEKSV
eukprot:14561458-Ditylum_brightwellii.AAC.1